MNQLFEKLQAEFRRCSDYQVLESHYIPILTTYTKQDAEINSLRVAKSEDKAHVEPEYFSALEMLDEKKRMVLTAGSGMGKSAFLKMCALCLAGEAAGDSCFNLAKLREPVIRSETGQDREAQKWTAKNLTPFWIDIAEWVNNNSASRDLPKEIESASIVLMDGVDGLSHDDWLWAREKILALCGKYPDLYFVIGCETNYWNRAQPKLPGFTSYSINRFIRPQINQLAQSYLEGYALADVPAAIENADPFFIVLLKNTQNLAFWIKMVCSGVEVRDFYADAVQFALKEIPLAEEIAAEIAWRHLTNAEGASLFETLPSDLRANLCFLEYLACHYCLNNHFSQAFKKLIEARGERIWHTIDMLKAISIKIDPQDYYRQIMALCPPSPEGNASSEDDCLAALASTELIFAARSRIHEAEIRSSLGTLQKWMKFILEEGRLAPYDRLIAGRKLSWLGDDRDLEALVEAPAGTFEMGDDNFPNNMPIAQVTLKKFRIGKYPVVNSSFAQFIQATGRNWLSNEQDDCERKNYPAVNLTWHDANAYCEWLTEKWRAEGKITDREIVRLPTEAEWEYAARGTAKSKKGACVYVWGNEWHDGRCNSHEFGLNDTCPVGIFPENISQFGCVDMNGQVWEWNSTLWGADAKKPDFPYPYNAQDGREQSRMAADNVRRCMRGGSFGSPWNRVTCAYRGALEPIGFWRGDGFRVVVSEMGDAE